MEIFANHAHVFQKEVWEGGSIDSLKKYLDECGIDKAICFAPFEENYRDNGQTPNRWMYEQLKNEDRFMAFGTIEFSKDNLEEQAEEIYQMGFAGIKMHPAYQKFKVDGERACRVYEVAEKRGLPISFHTGVHWHRISSYHTLLFDEVAYKFPEIKICMEHVGGYSFFNEAVAVITNNEGRVYAGLASVFHHDTHPNWYLGKEKVKDLIWLTNIDRCIFGLDFPYVKSEQVISAMQTMRECIKEMNLGTEAEEMVFGGNLRKMIGR